MYVHGDNLEGKENHKTKYRDAISKQYLKEIRIRYDEWKKANEDLKGPFLKISNDDENIITQRTKLLNEYKEFLEAQKYAEKFDSRSNLHSSVLEEFMYYLFRDLVSDFSKEALIGRAHTFKDLFFMPDNFKEMVVYPKASVETKDHDFVIGVTIQGTFVCNGANNSEKHDFQIPAVAIECKTYLDKTMLEGASNAALLLKAKNPSAMYLVVAEWLKLTSEINLNKYLVDQIYVLRKQKNTDREYRFLPSYKKNPIYTDTIWHLFTVVRKHLSLDWEASVRHGLNRGYLK